MRIFVFRSEKNPTLRAFAGDAEGTRLPQQHGPWITIGVIRPDMDPPHRLPRAAIEKAIGGQGYQLWRVTEKTENTEKKAAG